MQDMNFDISQKPAGLAHQQEEKELAFRRYL